MKTVGDAEYTAVAIIGAILFIIAVKLLGK